MHCVINFNVTGPWNGLSVTLKTHQSISDEFPCCYSTGEVKFTAQITLPKDTKLTPGFILYRFSFGDGTIVSEASENQKLTVTHNYVDVCITCVTEVLVIINPEPFLFYYYCNTTHDISVIGKICMCLSMYVYFTFYGCIIYVYLFVFFSMINCQTS